MMNKLFLLFEGATPAVIPEDARRMILYFLLFLVLVFVLIGAIGELVRKIMTDQASRADGLVHDVVVTGVITNERKLRIFGFKKNHRQFFKESWIPLAIIATSFLILLIYYMTMNKWGANPFSMDEFLTLFHHFDWDGAKGNFFGLNIVINWPAIYRNPIPSWDLWGSYLFVPVFLTGCVWYFVTVQAFIARDWHIVRLSKTVFNKSLKDYNPGDGPIAPIDPEDPSKVDDEKTE